MPYLLKDQRGIYDFIEPFVWNHFCYSFKRGGYSKAAMVSIWEAKRLKGCVFSPPSLLPVQGRGTEASKRNLSIASNPVSVNGV